MFIEALILSIIIGYAFKGNIKNIDTSRIRCIYMPFFAFAIETLIFVAVRRNSINYGTMTVIAYIIEYLLILSFTYVNRWNRYIVIMGIGFLMNALVIFTNGGTMPVSQSAVEAAGLNLDVSSEGLYTLIGSKTRLWFLGDIIYFRFLRTYIISIGDIISAAGLMLFIVRSMGKKGRHDFKKVTSC